MKVRQVGNFPFLSLFPELINLLSSKGKESKDRCEEEMSDCHACIEGYSDGETLIKTCCGARFCVVLFKKDCTVVSDSGVFNTLLAKAAARDVLNY